MSLTFIDFFAGVGGFRKGLELAGMTCLGYCEKDKFARKSYEAMYDTKGEWFSDDITSIEPARLPKADLWTAGSPCQNVSIAGKRAGLYGERSGLFFLHLLTSSRAKKKRINPNGYSLKMLRDFYQVAGDEIISTISLSWNKQGMSSNGKCSIPKITESHKIENESILSDILEVEVDDKYYLSAEKAVAILSNL